MEIATATAVRPTATVIVSVIAIVTNSYFCFKHKVD